MTGMIISISVITNIPARASSWATYPKTKTTYSQLHTRCLHAKQNMAITRSQNGISCPVTPKTIYWPQCDYEVEDIHCEKFPALSIDIPKFKSLNPRNSIEISIDIPEEPLSPLTPLNYWPLTPRNSYPAIPAIPYGPKYWYFHGGYCTNNWDFNRLIW